MLTVSQRLTGKRLADKYIGRDGGEPGGRQTSAPGSRLVLNVQLDMVEAGLAPRASADKRRQAAAAFVKLREILAEDYGLDAEPPRAPRAPASPRGR
jgi:hypothetical protein